MPTKHLSQYVSFFVSLDSRLLALQIISFSGDTRPDICGVATSLNVPIFPLFAFHTKDA